jgi:two-component system, LytTR family, response regulator LytT
MKVVIIEDEKLTAKDLANTIRSVEPLAEIVAILPSVAEGVQFWKHEPEIDLVFSDIELGDGQSFEIFERCQVNTPIIFCTAYNEYALQAFDTAGISYILKPFSAQSIAKAIQKFKDIQPQKETQEPDYQSIVQALQQQLIPAKIPNVIVHRGDRIIPIAGEKIAFFSVENTLVKAYTFEQEVAVVSQTLDDLEKKFAPYFFRANRQFLLNRKAVKEASQYFNRKLLVHLSLPFDEPILIGKEKTTAFLNWLADV